MISIAIFASGRGSNAKSIIEEFSKIEGLEVGLILTNKPDAGVLELAQSHQIPIHITNRAEFGSSQSVLPVLKNHKIEFIALAGFLWLIPKALLEIFPDRIVNIHPALLPEYGGKGMHGMHVHKAVKMAGETKSGITIHYVNEKYDEGESIFQANVDLDQTDSPEDIARKVLVLEHKHYPIVLKKLLLV
jgi:phosphoribosylglycinamide formyltransferase-1